MRSLQFLAVSFLLPALLFAKTVSTTEYFAYFFSYDDGVMTPDKTQTWASFVAVTSHGEKIERVEQHTISWLPISGVITAFTLGPERGRNYSMKETLDWAQRINSKVGDWGPYYIRQDLYERAVAFQKRLDSGEFWYRVIDSQNRIFKTLDPTSVLTPRAIMCSHAIADIVLETPADPRGFLITGLASGFKATAEVVWHLSDWFARLDSDPSIFLVAREETRALLNKELGLDAYPARQHFQLLPQNNHYCRAVEDCRELAGAAAAMGMDF